MRILPKFFSIFVVFSFTFCNICFAEKRDFYIEDLNSYRYELSSAHDEEVYINRLSAKNLAGFNYEKTSWGLSPSFEIRRHFIIERWYLGTLGVSLDYSCLKFVNLSAALQYSWIDIPNGYFKNPQRLDRNRLEVNPTLNITFPIREEEGGINPYISAFDEFYYDIEHGLPLRNEIGLGLVLSVNERVKLGLGWRHLDWVKSFDSDQVEISIAVRL